MIIKQIDGNSVNLSRCHSFVEHYNKPNSFAKEILEECNSGQWYHECLESLPKRSIIVDAGSNVGLWAAWIAPKADTIICVDPQFGDTLLSVLHHALKLGMRVCAYSVALWNKSGLFDFSESATNTTESKVSLEAGAKITCETLADVFAEYQLTSVDLLKLDIEGAEQQVILEDPTSGEALKRCRIVYIEVHPPPYGNADEQGIIEKMKSLGFTHHAGRRGLAHFFVNGN